MFSEITWFRVKADQVMLVIYLEVDLAGQAVDHEHVGHVVNRHLTMQYLMKC